MLHYGSSVFITAGKLKKRIGYLDDDDFTDLDKHIGYVCLGNPSMLMNTRFQLMI